MNKFITIGRTTADVELKTTQSKTYVANFSIAVKRNFKNGNGEYESDFFNCVAFGKIAEKINKYVRKGDLVGIEGRLQVRKYTDKNGNNRSATDVIVENIEFLQPRYKKEEQATEEAVATDPFADVDVDAELPF